MKAWQCINESNVVHSMINKKNNNMQLLSFAGESNALC